MSLDANLMNDDVLNCILNNMGMEDSDLDDTERANWFLKRVEKLTVYEAFDIYLTWNGIIGYTGAIIKALDNIRSCEKFN